MLWNRCSLTAKIFIAILAATTLIVLAMAVMVGVSMRAGFSRYLVQAEINRFDDLETALAQTHDADAGGWPELVSSDRAWSDFVGKHLRPARRPQDRPPPPPPPTDASAVHRRPPRPPRDPLHLSDRITLLNARGDVIAGAPPNRNLYVTRAIMPIDGRSSQTPIGFIGLSAPRHAAGPADAAFLSSQLRSLVFASVLALVLSAVAALLLARQFLAPLRTLSKGTRALSAGNYAIRLPNNRSDELGVLIQRYNVLAKNLEDAAAAERRWISDTSHDLQTPLAILMAEIEALQDGVRAPSADVLASLHGSVMRLSSLVRDLNTLARTREGGFCLVLEEIDLGAMIAEALADCSSCAAKNGICFNNQAKAGLVVSVDRQRVRQLIDNLLENARRYTVAPGAIRIATAANDDAVSVTVEDTAPCPPEGSMDRLFERFFRVEPSRSREHGGSGLGLAICRAIVEAHGGTIAAKASQLGGLAVIFTLPRSSDLAVRPPFAPQD